MAVRRDYDGFRGLCYVEHGRNRLISRNGNTFDRFEALADQVAAELDVNDALIDGEIIATDETGRPQFYDLLQRKQAARLCRFRYRLVEWRRPTLF